MRIDAHTHFSPPKFLEFAERAEGRPFGLSPLYKSLPALTGVQARIDLLDHNEIDINVLVPVPWIEGFHKIYADPALAARAARLQCFESCFLAFSTGIRRYALSRIIMARLSRF
jgi:hypothetical protein